MVRRTVPSALSLSNAARVFCTVLSGVAFGAAMLTKYSGIIWLPLWLLLRRKWNECCRSDSSLLPAMRRAWSLNLRRRCSAA